VHVLNDGSQTPYAAIKALKDCGFTAGERGAGIDKYFFDSDMISYWNLNLVQDNEENPWIKPWIRLSLWAAAQNLGYDFRRNFPTVARLGILQAWCGVA
jgi:hypothetical protein